MAILLFRPASTAHTGYTMAFLPSRYYLHTHIQDLHISNKNNSNNYIVKRRIANKPGTGEARQAP